MFFKSKDNSLPQMHDFYAENLQISIQVPEGWSISENQFFPFFLAAPAEKGYRANLGINAGTVEPPSEEGMAQTFEEAYQQQRLNQKNYKMVRSEKLEIDGKPALLRQTERVETSAGLTLTQLSGLIYAGDGLVYSISASTLKQQETKYLAVFNSIINSIKIEQEEELQP